MKRILVLLVSAALIMIVSTACTNGTEKPVDISPPIALPPEPVTEYITVAHPVVTVESITLIMSPGGMFDPEERIPTRRTTVYSSGEVVYREVYDNEVLFETHSYIGEDTASALIESFHENNFFGLSDDLSTPIVPGGAGWQWFAVYADGEIIRKGGEGASSHPDFRNLLDIFRYYTANKEYVETVIYENTWINVMNTQVGSILEERYRNQFGTSLPFPTGLSINITYEEVREAIETALEEGYADAVLQAFHEPAYRWQINTRRFPELNAEYLEAFQIEEWDGLDYLLWGPPAHSDSFVPTWSTLTMDELEEIVRRSIESGVNTVPEEINAAIQ